MCKPEDTSAVQVCHLNHRFCDLLLVFLDLLILQLLKNGFKHIYDMYDEVIFGQCNMKLNLSILAVRIFLAFLKTFNHSYVSFCTAKTPIHTLFNQTGLIQMDFVRLGLSEYKL